MTEYSITLSGKCGDSLTRAFDEGVLTVGGTGEMYDYNHLPLAGCANSSDIFLPLKRCFRLYAVEYKSISI